MKLPNNVVISCLYYHINIRSPVIKQFSKEAVKGIGTQHSYRLKMETSRAQDGCTSYGEKVARPMDTMFANGSLQTILMKRDHLASSDKLNG